ncbi:MAG: hypothetical protein AMXMBFR44_4010 [Candidatus Campbellbacteria bacterium]
MNLEQELQEIKERNRRVEGDKAWETSGLRAFVIALVTYVVAVVVLYLVGASKIFLSALVPVLGFYISTLSLPAIKRWWLRKRDFS